jgi:predicted DNA-binding transcriptional regulator AlpA
MAYQARVAIDRIKFAIKHTEQFSTPCIHMRDAGLQLLDALDRLESLDRRFQIRSRIATDESNNVPGARGWTMLRDYQELRLPVKAAGLDQTGTNTNHTDIASNAATLLDAKQVAQLLHVSESWVREHSNGKEPRLPAMKLGQGKTALVRFHMSDIEEFILSQRERARQRTLTQRRW